jgi:hypothetical protein
MHPKRVRGLTSRCWRDTNGKRYNKIISGYVYNQRAPPVEALCKIFSCFISFCFPGVRVSAVAGDTADRGDDVTFLVLIKAKIFLVDLSGHLKHAAGNIFFRFGVAGEIQMMAGAVRRRGVTEAAFYTKCLAPAIHHFFQVVVADILWQNLKIVFGLFVLGAKGGQAGEHEGEKAKGDDEFFAMQHIRNFGSSI